MLNTEQLGVSSPSEIEKQVKGFDGLVAGLKQRMVEDVNMRPVDGLDYEHDLLSWLDNSFVKLDESKTLKADIWTSDGRRLQVEPGVTKLVSNLEDAKTSESKLLGIAIIIAKLELVKDTISDVYPALGEEADIYLAALNQMKGEVLDISSSKERVNPTDFIPIFLRRLAILSAMVLAGCRGLLEVDHMNVADVNASASYMEIGDTYISSSEVAANNKVKLAFETKTDQYVVSAKPPKGFELYLLSHEGQDWDPWNLYTVVSGEVNIQRSEDVDQYQIVCAKAGLLNALDVRTYRHLHYSPYTAYTWNNGAVINGLKNLSCE